MRDQARSHWGQFAQTGDPSHYLEFVRARHEQEPGRERENEN
jgi:hypothetical protein